MKFPWVKPYFNGLEKEFAAKAVESTWISGGPFVNELEAKLAAKLKAANFLCVSNGTTAIECALRALGLGPEDEIIVPAFTFIAPVAMAARVGARIVFADVHPETWCLDVQDVVRKTTSKTRAVIAVHTYGNAVDMNALVATCAPRGIKIVEDTAEALMTTYNGRFLGTIGDAGTFSFHATKTLTTGEGGGVVFREQAFFEAAKVIRDHGMKERRYWHDVVGHNFRLTNMQAAVGCAQLQTLDQVCSLRERVFQAYSRILTETCGDQLRLQRIEMKTDPVMWALGVELSGFRADQRDRVMATLLEDGIETRPGFYAAPTLPPYRDSVGADSCPTAIRLSESIIALPFSVGLTEEDILWISKKLKQSL